MTSKVYIYDVDHTYVQLDSSDRGILHNISDYFTFEVPNAKYMASYKAKRWDGKIRLLNGMSFKIYKGLLPYILSFLDEIEDVEVELEESLENNPEQNIIDMTKFYESLNLSLTPFDYQAEAVDHSIKEKRVTLISPTSSGKSLMIYCIIRFLLNMDKKILLTVPNIGLVTQMVGDFKEYNGDWDVDGNVHQIYEGQDKNSDKPVYCSTWQSVYELGKSYFSQFDAILVDEAHGCSAESLKGILEKAPNAEYRIGFTGTLQETQCHRLVIEGLLGKARQIVDTKELTERGIVSKLKVNCAVLKYNDEIRGLNKKLSYQEEMKFIQDYTPRNDVIKGIINNIKGNTLILTAYRSHIKILEKLFPDKTVYVVHGGIDPKDREIIRKKVEKEDGVIVIATYGVYSTGVNVKNLQYVMFATGSKSQVRVLQSIGRGLRKDGKENKVILLDLVDDFAFKKKKNYILKHFFERIRIYENQSFEYKLVNVKLK